jgi:predicted nucleotidyltransferase
VSLKYNMGIRFSTHILDEAIEQKNKKREKLRLQLMEKLFETFDKLSSDISFNEAYLFGSITKPYKFTEESDIDIGFIGLKDEYYFKAMSCISREIRADVDVIQLEGHRLAEKIKKEGIKWIRKV